MTTDDGLGDPLGRVEPPRDRWGRVLLPDGSGRNTAYTRATTLAKALSGEKPGLVNWKLRLAVHGVVGNRTLHNLVAVTPLTEKEALDDIVARALTYAGANDGRTKGSTLHAACARARAVPGSYAALPDDLKADVTAYAKCLTAHGVDLDVDLIERMVVNDEVMSAGTFDDVVTVRGLPGRYVFDLKTAQDLSYEDAQSEIEIQLGVYANANHMVPKRWVGGKGRAQLEAMPEGISKRWGIVAHLPAGSGECTLHWVDIRRGWERARLAFQARKKGVGFVAWSVVAGDLAAAANRATATPRPATDEDLAIAAANRERAGNARALAEVEDIIADRASVDGPYVYEVTATGPDGAPASVEIVEKPKRKRRTRAEIEAAKAVDLPAVPVNVSSVADGGRVVSAPGPTPDPATDAAHDALAAGLTTGPDGWPVVPVGFPTEATTTMTFSVTQPQAGALVLDASMEDVLALAQLSPTGTFTAPSAGSYDIASGTFTPDRFGDEAKPDVSDAALDASLAARDARVRDEILAERKRIRIDAEIRAAIDDATKPGSGQVDADKVLATAWELWRTDWTDEHTAYAKTRMAALPPF